VLTEHITRCRLQKAASIARFLIGAGYTRAGVETLFTAESWRIAAQGAGVCVPSPTTQGLVLAMMGLGRLITETR